MNSVCAAVCLAPILLIAMCVTLGWNEQRAVCGAKAISAGKDIVQPMGCTNANEHAGELVMMNCDIQRNGLVFEGGLRSLKGYGDFSSLQVVGTGLKVEAEMYQCVEHSRSETKKDSHGGGGQTTITTYTYSMEWKSEPVNSRAFHKTDSLSFQQNCGAHNPEWPTQVPRSGSQWAKEMKVGAARTKMTRSVPLNIPVTPSTSTFQPPRYWARNGKWFRTEAFRVGKSGVGDVRVAYYINDWSNPAVTLLGMNTQGFINEWTAPSSWLCAGSTLLDLRMGSYTKDYLFTALENDNTTVTWIIRVLGFALMWLAFSLMFAPLGVVADCIPCIGPFLGDSVETISCCISCLPATACCSLIVGIVWIAMRPMVGIPLVLFFFVVMAGFAYVKMNANRSKSLSLASREMQYGAAKTAAPVGAAPVAVATPVQPSRQFLVQVPAGCGPGSTLQVTSPDGVLMHVTVPERCYEGSTFAASY
jgi:hypothetical protein